MKDSDVRKLIGCDNVVDMSKYIVDMGSLKTDPSNLKDVKLNHVHIRK